MAPGGVRGAEPPVDTRLPAPILRGMAEADFSDVLRELDALEAEVEAIRVTVDEGEEMLAASPTARQTALRHLDTAVRHTVDSARALIEEADWEEPEDNLDAIEILVEEEVLPGRLGATLTSLADYTTEHAEEGGWESETDASDVFDRLSEAAEALAEYQEYVQHFLKEWEQ